MSEQTKEGERMTCILNGSCQSRPKKVSAPICILSIWISEQTEEGERMICILSTWMSEQTEEGERKKQVEERERVNCIFSKFGSQNRPKKVSKNVEVYSPRRSPEVCGRNKTTYQMGASCR